MRRWRLAVALGVLSVGAGAVVACGLDGNGLLADGGVDGGMDVRTDVVVSDVQVDVPAPPPCADAGPSCGVPFRTAGLFALSQNTPCPNGFNTQDLVESAHAHDTKCTCQCDDGGAPACDLGTVNMQYTDQSGCADASVATMGSADGGCGDASISLQNNGSFNIDTPKLVGGCTGGTGVPTSTTVDGTDARLCVPADCTEAVCQPQTGFMNCQYIQGTVTTCPDGYDGGIYYAGAGAQVTCDTCSCGPTGDCGGAQISLYNDNACGTAAANFAADGKCHAVDNQHAGTYNSVSTTTKAPTGVKCAVSNPTPDAGVAFAQNGAFTICCKP